VTNISHVTSVCTQGRNLTLEIKYKEWLSNTFQNQEQMSLYKDVSRWNPFSSSDYKTSGYYVTPVVVGSGPSLVDTIGFLKRITFIINPLIISVYAAVPFLMHHGITPHGIILMDSHKDVLKRWMEFPKVVKETYFSFLCAQHCNPGVMDYLSRNYNLFTFKSFAAPHTDPKAAMYNTTVDIMTPFLKTFITQLGDSPNAAILLLDNMKSRGLINFNEIILAGVDHSWNKAHLRVPYYNDNGLVISSSWAMKDLPCKEVFPGVYTDEVLQFYDEELLALREVLLRDDKVEMFVLTKDTLAGNRLPVYKIGGRE